MTDHRGYCCSWFPRLGMACHPPVVPSDHPAGRSHRQQEGSLAMDDWQWNGGSRSNIMGRTKQVYMLGGFSSHRATMGYPQMGRIYTAIKSFTGDRWRSRMVGAMVNSWLVVAIAVRLIMVIDMVTAHCRVTIYNWKVMGMPITTRNLIVSYTECSENHSIPGSNNKILAMTIIMRREGMDIAASLRTPIMDIMVSPLSDPQPLTTRRKSIT